MSLFEKVGVTSTDITKEEYRIRCDTISLERSDHTMQYHYKETHLDLNEMFLH